MQRMDTLDKLWGSIPEEEEDTRMMDTGEETELNSVSNKKQTTKTAKTTKTTTIDNNDSDIKPLYTVIIRFNFHVNSKDTAFNKHYNVLKSIYEEIEHCEIYILTTILFYAISTQGTISLELPA